MDQPSYVLFITDQQRFDNLGCYGHPVLHTPNIDSMADEGVVVDDDFESEEIADKLESRV